MKDNVKKAPVERKPVIQKKADSPCPVWKKCGGCKWIHKVYSVKLKEKEKWVQELMKPFCKMEPIIGMENPILSTTEIKSMQYSERTENIM